MRRRPTRRGRQCTTATCPRTTVKPEQHAGEEAQPSWSEITREAMPTPSVFNPVFNTANDMTRTRTAIRVAVTQPPALESVPEALRRQLAWVAWRSIRDGARRAKLPCDPRTGHAASCADPATWATFGDAVAAYRRGGYDGIGLQLTPPIVGVDLDGCRHPDTGVIAPSALAVVRELQTYTEISPSECGLHVLALGRLPAGWRRRGDLGVEVYDSARFFAVTGHHLPGTPRTVQDRADVLAAWHARHRPRPPDAAIGSVGRQTPHLAHASLALTDTQLLHRAMGASNGAKFARLWRGDWSDGYPSQSEADLALCTRLAFWTGRDAHRIDRLFRVSRLYRLKWDVVHGVDGRTYGERTVARAVASVTSVWSPSFRTAAARPHHPVGRP